STVFWLGLASGAGFYILIYTLAPLLAQGHGAEEVTRLFRVSGIVLLMRPLYLGHRAMLRRQLRFKELSVLRMIANFAEFGVKIGTAAAGYGIWCFAVSPIARELTYSIGTPAILRWRPRLFCKPRIAIPD